MKILYLHPNAWTGEYPILGALRERGATVCVLEEKRGVGAGLVASDHFRTPGDGIATLWHDPGRGAMRLATWPLDRVFRRAFDSRNLAHRMSVIRAAVARIRPDVLACTDGFSYAIPAAFLRRLGLLDVPVMASYIGGDILDCPEAAVGKRRTPMVNWLIRSALQGVDAMRPLCASLERILIRDGAPRERIHVVPIQLGVPLEKLASIRARKDALASSLRERLGIPAGAPLLVTLSGNQKGKGLQLLAGGWGRLSGAIPGLHWLLCGPEDPWLAQGVRPLLEAGGAGGRVRFTGRLEGDAVYEHLAAGDLHVNPTLCEGLNMVTVEAAAVGTPTVTSDGAGIADWVARHAFGAVVSAGDGPALETAIREAFADPARLANWRGNAPSIVNEFSLDAIAARLMEIFRNLTANRRLSDPM